MKTISPASSFSDVKTAALALNLDASLSSADIFELWDCERYQGGFATLPALIEEINERIQAINLKKESASRKADELKTKLAGATAAAVLQHGKVIGMCITAARNGGYIDIAGGLSADGAPVNVVSLKISRSQKNMNKAKDLESYTPRTHGDEIIYV
ncbi:hypothetical protein [Dickeya solani]|uniref:Uncharacterized protein n=1 Tax=Dickeya solani TaxID=1089444 RepID=A0ABU4EL58_9GAMM|nr:hypothetical protein [Dickeya solani]MCA6998199.1 hypothetical protein [Dickeya solani]MDV6997170.1 hypothetical protein [Dickeya solani]MDV7004481.1 hypothetical protein [Dickeya solani]MDV7040357.1 hypothetical protein [Dickeya solani]MDV7044808.1 hypothetical protein [Dickeya solani]